MPVSPEERAFSFSEKPLWMRASVVAAGPLVNLLFAVIVLWAVFMLGIPVMRPVIGPITPGGLAAEAGLAPRDEIVGINHRAVHSWEEVMLSVIEAAASGKTTLDIDIQPLESEISHTAQIVIPKSWLKTPEPDFFTHFGLEPYDPVPPVVLRVADKKPASQAGFKAGDKIIRADGQEIVNRNQFAYYIHAHPKQKIAVTVLRQQREKVLFVIPEQEKGSDGKAIGLIGIEFIPGSQEWDAFFITQGWGPIESLQKALERTWRYSVLTLEMIGKMIKGDASLKNIGGPVTIAKQAGHSISMGLVSFLQFLATISVSLGVLNLLPVPMLDGGHLLFYAYEAVRRKPLSLRYQEAGYRMGFVMLMILMGLALYNDFSPK
jgi:regulator of sigma E protease